MMARTFDIDVLLPVVTKARLEGKVMVMTASSAVTAPVFVTTAVTVTGTVLVITLDHSGLVLVLAACHSPLRLV